MSSSILGTFDWWAKLRYNLSGAWYKMKKTPWAGPKTEDSYCFYVDFFFLGWKEQYKIMAINPKDGSWVWTGHRQGPALCKAGHRGAQDSMQYPLKVCLPQGWALTQTVHLSNCMKTMQKMTYSWTNEKLGFSLPPEEIKLGVFGVFFF